MFAYIIHSSHITFFGTLQIFIKSERQILCNVIGDLTLITEFISEIKRKIVEWLTSVSPLHKSEIEKRMSS